MIQRLLFALLLLSACAQSLHAQIQVDLKISRRLFVVYEPIVATVTITNRSGRDVPLADADSQHWFGFEIVRASGEIIGPINPNYELDPLVIPAGETVKRSVNLNALFPVHDFGINRIRANVYFAPMQKYFVSRQVNIEITDGTVIWRQTVGVPDGEKGAGGTRNLSLLKFRQGDKCTLYVRVEDANDGTIYCTIPLGAYIEDSKPQVQIDFNNRLHLLQFIGPKTWAYTRIGTNGEWLGQDIYTSAKNRPTLHRDSTAEISVKGGELQAPRENGATPAPGLPIPKLSDRPADLPKD
ncbi:MAG: hypothetical protein WCP06_08750 [Verrucomicrobiota bacterium]